MAAAENFDMEMRIAGHLGQNDIAFAPLCPSKRQRQAIKAVTGIGARVIRAS